MNNKTPLKIFTTSYLQNLKDEADSSNDSLLNYLEKRVQFKEDGVAKTRIEVEENIPILDTSADKDAENAVKVYEYLNALSESVACDERVWSYLAHETFREHMLGRWPIEISATNVTDREVRKKAVTSIKDHWFYGQRGLVRNGIARLWWGAHVTVAPWENGDEEFYADLDKTDRYRYTKLLFSKSVIYQQIMEREQTRPPRIRTTLLEYVYDNQDITKEQIGDLAKRIDMANSYRKLDRLNYKQLRRVIDGFAEKSKQ